MKKVLSLTCIIAILLMCIPVGTLAYNEDIIILIDSQALEVKDANGNIVKAFIDNGSTYLPLRGIAEAFNLSVEWDNETKTVYINGNNGAATLSDHVNIFIDEKEFISKDVNGNIIYPHLIDGSVFLPARAISEALGKIVSWDGAIRTVSIDTIDNSDPIGMKYYRIINKGTNKALVATDNSLANGSTLTTGTADDSGDYIWQLSKCGDSIYGICNYASGKAIDIPNASTDKDIDVIQWDPNGGSNQSFKLSENEDGTYTLMAMHSSLYLDAEGEFIAQREADEDSPYQKWTLEFVKDSTLKNVLTSEGFYKLNSLQQRAFKTYMFSKLNCSSVVSGMCETFLTKNDYYNKDALEQRDLLEEALTFTAYGQVTGNVADFSYKDYTVTNTRYSESHDMWINAFMPAWIHDIEMKGDIDGQVHTFDVASNLEETPVVEDAAKALGVFPYGVTKWVKHLYFRNGDEANSYNSGGDSMWIRLMYEPSFETIVQYFAHELGHTIDTNVSHVGEVWSWAQAMDAVGVSGYGFTTRMEDLAEFHRLFFTTLGKDTEQELNKVYPNRYEVLKGLLYRSDSEYFADYKYYADNLDAREALIEQLGKDSDTENINMLKYYKLIDVSSGKALTIKDNAITDGANITLADFNDLDSQKFSFEKYGDFVKIVNKGSNLAIHFDVSALPGKAIYQTGDASYSDSFALVKADTGYNIISKNYNMGIGLSDGTAVQSFDMAEFELVELEEETGFVSYTISTPDNKVLTSPTDRTNVFVKEKDDSKSQTWMLKEVRDGAYTIINSESGFAVDISGASIDSGAELIVWDVSNDDNQLFKIEKSDDDKAYLVMLHSNLYLTVNEDGTISQEQKDESKNQLFILNEVK